MQKYYIKKTIKTMAIITAGFALFMICLIYMKHLNDTNLRRKGDIGCLISNPKCFSIAIYSKEEFIKEMERLDISKKEAIQELTETKKKWDIKCKKYDWDSTEAFEYIDRVLQYLDEIPD